MSQHSLKKLNTDSTDTKDVKQEKKKKQNSETSSHKNDKDLSGPGPLIFFREESIPAEYKNIKIADQALSYSKDKQYAIVQHATHSSKPSFTNHLQDQKSFGPDPGIIHCMTLRGRQTPIIRHSPRNNTDPSR